MERKFKCNTCDKMYRKAINLKRHQKIHEKPFQCKYCYHCFTEASILTQHTLLKHSHLEQKIECTICQKKFKPYKLKRHEKIHNGQKSWECEICGKILSTPSKLKTHQKLHTAKMKSFECETCKKTFGRSSEYKRHQKLHTITTKSFECNICDKKFTLLRYLRRHQTKIHAR